MMEIRNRLNAEGIEDALKQLETAAQKEGIDRRKQENLSRDGKLLFHGCGKLFPDAPFVLQVKKSNGDLKLPLYAEGKESDPAGEDGKVFYDLQPVLQWRYENGQNRYYYVFHLYNTTRKSFAFSWNYVKQHKGTLLFAVGCQLISAFLGVAAPIVSARIIRAYANNEAWRVMYIAAAILVIQLLRNLFLVISNQSYNRMYAKTLTTLENDLVKSVLEMENRCMNDNGSGLFIQRLTKDTGSIASGFNSLADMIAQLLSYAGVLIAMFIVSPMVCLFVVVIMTVQTLMEVYRTKRLRQDDRAYRTANDRFYGIVGEMVRGSKDIKLLNSEADFAKEVSDSITETNYSRLYMQKRSWGLKLVRFEAGEFGSFAMIALLAYLIAEKRVLPSTALVLYNYYADLGPNAVKFFGSFMDYLADFNLSNERVQALMNEREFPREHFGTRELESMKGEIVFDHVTFSYDHADPENPGRNVLEDMCFAISPGQTVGLVGRSGCGKTTVFNLIDKLYEADKGQVKLDGIDIKELSRDAIRGNITVVSQNPYIFNMTVRDNLKVIKPELTDEEMREICRLACIDEDIMQLPQGYDTVIGEGGTNLSGGQRQRLAIARAMIRDTRIILFDEATSALDNVTQANIQVAIDNMRKGRTVVLVAHRLSTVMSADNIMYMQDGKILDQGPHEKLLETCEPYRTLAEMEGSANNETL